MGLGTRIGKVADATYSAAAAATSKAFTITWTTNDPTASTAATVADGSAVTSAETGVLFKSMEAQITAMRTDIENLRTSQVASAADVAAMLAQLNAGE
jgi:hypothetical protein